MLLQNLSHENKKLFWDLVSLLIFIYCSAILGDYVAEALVIKQLTVDILPKLFQINAALLFAISFFLFGFVDKFHRWQIFKALTVLSFCLVLIFGFLLKKYSFACMALYSTAYISKLSFFTLFWIIANDICDTRKSKAIFPMLAGSGLLGGLISTILSGKIVHLVHVENLIWLWALLAILPFFIINKIIREYSLKLHAPSVESKGFQKELNDIFNERAVVIMATVYFLIFLLIFNLDFIFAKTLSKSYELPAGFNAEGFISFKFNIFLIITVLIIFFQFIYTSNISKRFGVTNSMLVLPVILCLGFVLLYGLRMKAVQAPVIFFSVLVFYILRQFLFESLFSSNYQIFFSAFSRRFRGKGKLLLEGLIKPFGIAAAGLMILFFQESKLYFALLALLAACLTLAVHLLKREYSKVLLDEEFAIPKDDMMNRIKQEISGKNREKILSLISKALEAKDYDLKRVAIKYLEYSGSPAAFELLRKKFFEESDRIKELIANSLSTFDSLEARGFLRKLLESQNPAIQAGALKSIRKNPLIKPKNFNFIDLIYVAEPAVFEEATCLVFSELSVEERNVVYEKINNFLNSERIDEKTAAFRLIGFLKLDKFFDKLVMHFNAPSYEVWKSAIHSLLQFNHEKALETLLKYLDGDIDRNKEHVIIEGLGSVDFKYYSRFETFLLNSKKKRTAFSLIRILRHLSAHYLDLKGRPVRQKAEVKRRIVSMAMEEMKKIYMDVYRYYDLRINLPLMHKKIDLLKDALREKRKRFAMFILDMLSIIDNSGALLNIERNFKMLSEREKANIIELIEAFGERNISRLLIPILEEYNERELLKIGSYKWKYKQRELKQAIKYFIGVKNRWIGSIALYVENEAIKNAA